MIVTSALLVFGALAVFLRNVVGDGGTTVPFGGETLLLSNIAWPFVAALTAGALIGIAAFWKRPSKPRGALVATEVLVAILGLWFFFGDSVLPEHTLAISVGEPFPQYALADQEGIGRRGPVTAPPSPKLYIFYRGDW